MRRHHYRYDALDDALAEKLEQMVANVKAMTLPKGSRLGKTKRYYKTFSGGCRQMFTVNGRVDEFPYSAKKAVPCRLPGPHPHKPPRKSLPQSEEQPTPEPSA